MRELSRGLGRLALNEVLDEDFGEPEREEGLERPAHLHAIGLELIGLDVLVCERELRPEQHDEPTDLEPDEK